jgi:hypothetical protein
LSSEYWYRSTLTDFDYNFFELCKIR